MINLIKKYIDSDPVSYIHIYELLDREYKIEYASNNGFIIHDLQTGFVYISFNNEEVMKEVLSNRRYDSYLCYEKMICDYYGDTEKMTRLYQYAYMTNKKKDVSGYDVRVLDESYIDVINKVYRSLDPDESMLDHLKNKEMLGIFEDNKLAGFVGRHKEGCIGQLLVFNEYRHKGYAYILEASMINKLMDEKQRIFGEVLLTNDISNHLQEKLGFERGNKIIYWLVKKYD